MFRFRYWPAWLALLAGTAVSSGLGWRMHQEAVALDTKRFTLRIKTTVDELDGRIEKTEALMRQLQDYLMFSGESRNRVFEQWCSANGLSFNCRWVHGIAVATNRNRIDWEREMPKSPATWSGADWERLKEIALKYPIECDIALKTASNREKFLDNYDLNGMMADTKGFSRLVRRAGPRMSDIRPVMLDTNGNILTGAVLLVPAYRSEINDLLAKISWSARARAEPARWLHLNSVILAPIDFKALEEAIWYNNTRDLGVEIFDSKEPRTETWLNPTGERPAALDRNFKPYLKTTVNWPMYGDSWTLFFYTTPLFEAQSPRRLAWLAVGAGIAMTLLTTALLGVTLRARYRQELMTDNIREARDALAAAEKQRQKLSHDLHDNAAQSLYAIQLTLVHVAQDLKNASDRTRRDVDSIRIELDAVQAELRKFIVAEESHKIKADLADVLRSLVQRAGHSSKAKVELHCEPEVSARIASEHAVQLANIAREAISNSLRHGKPEHVRIALRSETDGVEMEIADDGRGFEPNSPHRRGVGLTSMKTRAAEMGALLQINTVPGKGTSVLVRIPASPVTRD